MVYIYHIVILGDKMNKKILTRADITGIDIELTGSCNLKCPLCLSQFKHFKHQFKHHFLDIDFVINELKSFKNLNVVSLAGDASEPTLHPDLIKLLDWLKTQPQIKTELYTNASLYDESYWEELNKHFCENSIVYFTICGSNQELHEKYRVNSKLDKVLKNALAFRKNNPYKNDYLTYIRFNYNKHDAETPKVEKIFNQFSKADIIETDPIYERFNLDSEPTDIWSEQMFAFFYKRLYKKLLNKSKKQIECYSYKNKYIRMDNFGNYSPCVCYKLYRDNNFVNGNQLDYSEFFDNPPDFCIECEKEMIAFLNKNDRDAFYMC